MPIARVQTPDGRIARLEVPEGTTPEQVEAFVAENYGASAPEAPKSGDNKPHLGKTILDQSLQGATFGFADEITDRIGAGIASLVTGEKYDDMLKEARTTTQAELKREMEERPIVSTLSQIGGGLVTGGAGAATKTGATVGNVLRSGNLAARVGKGVVAGATSGAAYGAGSAEDGNRLEGAATGAVAGGALGGAIPIATAAGRVLLHPVKSATDAVKLLDNITDRVAGGASKAINRSDVPKALADLSDPEILFVKTLTNEGISVDDALGSLKAAKDLKATPSVSVTSNVPQMQTQAYLTSRGSAGSKVAAQAIKDIDEVQIPSLNKKIIDQATGGRNLGAEEYGKIVGTEAKKLVDKKAAQLRTRASPYYARSVGVDKSVPIEAPEMKKALGNRLVVKALEDARTDAYTLSTTARDLAELGVDAGDIAQLPYNSTVSLHAARTQLRQLGDAAFAAGEKTKGAAIKNALADIDNAIESAFPDYKTARRIYSEDAGALKVLKDSPVGRMAQFAEGDYSKIANDLMTKDAGYIKKFVNGLGDNQKMKDSLAGAFLKRQLEEATHEGRRFSDKVFKSEGTSERLKAIVGEERFAQMKKVDTVIDDLLKTRSIPSQSITAAAQSVKGGVDVPVDKAGLVDMVRKKIAPSLFEMVQRNPQSAARYNELLFTDEGYKLLEKISTKTKFADPKEMQAVADFLNMNADKVGAAAR